MFSMWLAAAKNMLLSFVANWSLQTTATASRQMRFRYFAFLVLCFSPVRKAYGLILGKERSRGVERERERHTHTEGGMRESTNLCTNAHTKHYQAMLATETRLMAGRMGRDGKGREGAGRGGEGLGRKG